MRGVAALSLMSSPLLYRLSALAVILAAIAVHLRKPPVPRTLFDDGLMLIYTFHSPWARCVPI